MAIIEQQFKTPYGLQRINLLRCDHCDELSTVEAALGWVRVEELGGRIETFADEADSSGHYCSKQCLVEEYKEQGVIANMTAVPDDTAPQEAINVENG